MYLENIDLWGLLFLSRTYEVEYDDEYLFILITNELNRPLEYELPKGHPRWVDEPCKY